MTSHSRVGNRYVLIRRLGAGGMGEVWLAADERLGGKRVAVKRMPPIALGGSSGETDVANFQREAHAAAALRHRHVVSVTDFFVEDGSPTIVMDYIAGRSLDDLLLPAGLDPSIVARIGSHVAGALAATHAAGLIHRDVKPSNVIVDDAGSATLVDFGIARRSEDPRLTGTGMFRGTLAYLAPETFDGAAAAPPGDMWALGATLFEALHGRPAFDGPTHAALIAAIMIKEVPRAASGTPLDGLIAALLDRDPAARPDAAETRARLAEAPASLTRDDSSVTRVTRATEVTRVAGVAVAAPWRSTPPGPEPPTGPPASIADRPSFGAPAHPSGPFPAAPAAPWAPAQRTRARGRVDAVSLVALLAALALALALFALSFDADEPENLEFDSWLTTDRIGPLVTGLTAGFVLTRVVLRLRSALGAVVLVGMSAGLVLQYAALLALFASAGAPKHSYVSFEQVRIVLAVLLVVASVWGFVRHRSDPVGDGAASDVTPMALAWVVGWIAVAADVWASVATTRDVVNHTTAEILIAAAPYALAAVPLIALARPPVRRSAVGRAVLGFVAGGFAVFVWDFVYLLRDSQRFGSAASTLACACALLSTVVFAGLGVRAARPRASGGPA